MTMEAKIRPWLLIVLLAVVIIGGGFTYWYVYANKDATTAKTSPTPTKSVVSAPSVGTTPQAQVSPKVSNLPSSTPAEPVVNNKNYEGALLSPVCLVFDIFFTYPGDQSYTIRDEAFGTVEKTNFTSAIIENGFGGSPIEGEQVRLEEVCQKNTDPNRVFELYQKNGWDPEISAGPTSITVNGKQAIQWTNYYKGWGSPEQGRYYKADDWEKHTIIMNDNNFVVISSPRYSNQNQELTEYNLIVNSFQFK